MDRETALKELQEAIRRHCPSPATLSLDPKRTAPLPPQRPVDEPIAIVGLAGYFPGADSVEAFWRIIDQGISVIGKVPEGRLVGAGVAAAPGVQRDRWAGLLPDVAGFDPGFFGISVGEAPFLDPRQRLLLMCAVECLWDAGFAPSRIRSGNTGVFIAAQDNEYRAVLEAAAVDTRDLYAQSCLLANRLSHYFDFRGDSEVVEAQCPSAAVALHHAIRAIRSGEIEQALVGGAHLLLSDAPFALLSENGQLSSDRTVASFGAQANGHVRAEGVAMVFLMPLSLALKHGATIHALVRGSAVNFNGQGGASISAPNPRSHSSLIQSCYERAGIDPRRVTYIEAQGMGNPLADLAEWHAFNDALTALARRQGVVIDPGNCRISTLKPLIGHMESTSALGALFKIIRGFRTDRIQRVVDFAGHHPEMKLEGQPCFIATETLPWPRTEQPRLAGLHSYGMSGTNAHLLIEEFRPAREDRVPAVEVHPALVIFSAHTRGCLLATLGRFQAFLEDPANAGLALEDMAYTLQVGRDALAFRAALVVESLEGLRAQLPLFLKMEDGGALPRGSYYGVVAEARGLSRVDTDDLHALAREWVSGAALDWAELHRGQERRRLHLPGVAFERKKFWMEPTTPAQSPARSELVRGLPSAERLMERFRSMVGELLNSEASTVDPDAHWIDLGLDSVAGLRLLRTLGREFGITVRARDLVEHPSIARLSHHLSRRAPEAAAPSVSAKPENAIAQEQFPLSEGQKGLWTLQQLFPESAAYNIPLCFRLRETLDKTALNTAFAALAGAFPVLASRFRQGDHGPVRVVAPEESPPISWIDARQSGRDPLELEIKRHAKTPFDLERDAPIRLAVFTSADDDHWLLFTLHHIVFDGGSFLPLARQFFDAYLRQRDGGGGPTGIVEDDYPRHVEAERALLAGPAAREALDYWREQFREPPPACELPTDFPRSRGLPFRGAASRLVVEPALAEAIRDFARIQKVNLSTFWLAIFKILLHRYSAQDDLIVGMPESGRQEERFRHTVGFFVNMLPVRSRGLKAHSAVSLLQSLQLTMADALDHAAYPFPKLIRELGLAPDESMTPLFRMAFEYQNIFSSGDLVSFDREFQPQLEVSFDEAICQEGEYELVLEVREKPAGFVLNLKFNPTLYRADSIDRMLRQLPWVCRSVIAAPDTLLPSIDCLPPEERATLLREFNQTRVEFGEADPVHRLFGAWARRTPDAPAVVFGERVLDYRELDTLTDAWAAHLLGLGLKPAERVGVCLERSADLVIALLAIAKAGAAWVPLDPNYPAERLAHVLADSGVSWVLVHASLNPLLEGIGNRRDGSGLTLVGMDTEAIAPHGGGGLVGAAPDNLAYVIYTSGSTGLPKGVMIEHRALTNFLLSMRQWPGFERGDTLLALTTPSFDIAALELLLPLVAGGCVHVLDTPTLSDPGRLREAIDHLRPTVVQATPSTWSMLFHQGWTNPSGAILFCGGEPLAEELRQRMLALGCRVWNLYGPTETTIWSTVASSPRVVMVMRDTVASCVGATLSESML